MTRTSNFDHLKSKQNDGPKINHEIKATAVRLIGEDGEMIGVVNTTEALRLAQLANLDLVELSPNAVPPVCKILDYGKYKYELQKKKNEAKKKQKVIEVKEIQIRPMIDTNDLMVKTRAINRFIEDGNKVKIVMRFKGREVAHNQIGMDLLLKLQQTLQDTCKVDQSPKLEGRQIVMLLSPIKAAP